MTTRGRSIAGMILSTRLRRLAFWAYTAALFTATHWPKVELPGPPHTDKALHIVVFGLWTLLFALTGYIRPIRRPGPLLAITLIAAAWSGLDELLQEIPFINRHATIHDYYANLVGVAAGLVAALIVAPLFEQADENRSHNKTPDSRG